MTSKTQHITLANLWFEDGIAYGSTPSCGCCAESYHSSASDNDDLVAMGSPHKDMRDLEFLATWVETRERNTAQLRAAFNEYCLQQENG